jgi:hypothetical protein
MPADTPSSARSPAIPLQCRGFADRAFYINIIPGINSEKYFPIIVDTLAPEAYNIVK